MLFKTMSLGFLLVFVALTGLACTGVPGSGTAASDTRTVGAFTEVEVHGVIELELELGSPHSVELTGDDNLLPLVEAVVQGNRLVIRSTKSMRPELPLVAKVTAPDVSLARGSGATKLRIAGVDNTALTVELSGAGKGEVAGKTETFTVDLSGAGTIDAAKLTVKSVKVDVSGAGRVSVAEPDELTVDISGAGTVRYGGSPKITKNISGAGKLDKR
ncbi:MAG: DUF2807 domain-containing protein [Deltaproteobacteria bacterium]|nr:DUF2807 domain-containing protein [Deltaproteobacteria bacterium]